MSSIEPEKSLEFMDTLVRKDEFKEGQSLLTDPMERRSFLKVMAASAAAIGLSSCNIRKPVNHIRPYAKQPEYLPSEATYFATSLAQGATVNAVLAKVQEGRPTKLEGNPDYYNGNGSSFAVTQAEILNLYDPDRLKDSQFEGKLSSLETFQEWLLTESVLGSTGEGVAILTAHIPSPSYRALIADFKKKFPKAKVFEYEGVHSDAQKQALKLIYGQDLRPSYDLENAKVIVSFGSNFLYTDPEALKLNREFAKGRDPESTSGMNRLYVFEETPSVTGSQADHRVALSGHEIEKVLIAIATGVLAKTATVAGAATLREALASHDLKIESHLPKKLVDAIVDDLWHNRSKSLVVINETMSVQSQALVAVLNDTLGNLSHTLHYFPVKSISDLGYMESIKTLTAEIRSSAIKSLFVISGNPVYQAPVELSFKLALKQLKHRVHLTALANDTSHGSNWVLPLSHSLESWGDLESIDGTVTMVQPVIQPLYRSVSAIQFLQLLMGSSKTDHDYVQDRLFSLNSPRDKESSWKQWCQNGIVSGRSGAASLTGRLRVDALTTLLSRRPVNQKKDHLELVLYPDDMVYDGRHINNPWLQECPNPITKLTWDNALLIHPETAKKASVKTGDIVRISARNQEFSVPVLELPGQAKHSVSLSLGYGQQVAGKLGSKKGFNGFQLLYSDAPFRINLDGLKATGETFLLAMTQELGDGSSQHGRPLHRAANLADYQHNPQVIEEMGTEHPELKSLWQERKYDTGNQWGMTIDLSTCLGCQACVVACQSENNIPSVGKNGVLAGREMHWIRIDRYFEETEDHQSQAVHQPVACIHCENAPCEQVCPVNATVHDQEGLNVMVYNRCIGTRYCSNNCPIKVRRFNFFDWHQASPHSQDKQKTHLFDYVKEPAETHKLQFNPQVTVRMRGVMEKCTYCTQRIEEGKSTAANQGRQLKDQDIRTACQQACPSSAIEFGNILDPDSKVSKKRKLNRRYALLEELNIKPRTLFLGAIKNPNPVLVSSVKKEEPEHAKHH